LHEDDYLLKPFEDKALVMRVKNYCVAIAGADRCVAWALAIAGKPGC